MDEENLGGFIPTFLFMWLYNHLTCTCGRNGAKLQWSKRQIPFPVTYGLWGLKSSLSDSVCLFAFKPYTHVYHLVRPSWRRWESSQFTQAIIGKAKIPLTNSDMLHPKLCAEMAQKESVSFVLVDFNLWRCLGEDMERPTLLKEKCVTYIS